MKLVVFGLSVSSSWGNGHATIWRGLIKGLTARGHAVVFFEKDVQYYAYHRDLTAMPGLQLILYENWDQIAQTALRQLGSADAGMVTSYCPDALRAQDAVVSSSVPARIFYDLDTPVTLHEMAQGNPPAYVGPTGYRDYDLVLSYTGGAAIEQAQNILQARRAAPLYGCVDPQVHGPVAASDDFRGDLSYLGTYAADRQDSLNKLFVEPARRFPGSRFVLGGAQYPDNFPWTDNMMFVRHVPPPLHPQFYCSARFTLNVTRPAMALMGFCPSGRLFEAAACGVAILSDFWPGLDRFFSPGREIAIVNNAQDVAAALEAGSDFGRRLGRAARERVLDEHTCHQRARELEEAIFSLR